MDFPKPTRGIKPDSGVAVLRVRSLRSGIKKAPSPFSLTCRACLGMVDETPQESDAMYADGTVYIYVTRC